MTDSQIRNLMTDNGDLGKSPSSLDDSVQSLILNQLNDLKKTIILANGDLVRN